MTNESARIILLQMLDGLDPTTGAVLPPDHLLNDATVIRALHTAVLALTDISHPVRAPVNRNGRLNAGRAWTEMDRDALAVLSRSGASMEMMCEKPVSYTHLRAHETGRNLVCRLLLEKKKKKKTNAKTHYRTITPETIK